MKQFLPSKLRVSHGTKIWSLLLLIGLATLPGCVNSSLQSIQVLPATGAQLSAAGATLQFKAIGTYSHGSHLATTQDITGLVSWTSSNEGAATVNSSGMATALTTGNATISANGKGSFLGVTGSAALAVAISGSSTGPRVLNSIAILPAAQTITSVGGTAQFVAIGTFTSSPLTQDLTKTALWNSTETSVATINTVGLATGVAAGTSTITASATNADGSVITTTAAVTVTSTAPPVTRDLVSIAIVPGPQTLTSVGATAQYFAIGTYSAAPLTVDLSAVVVWKSTLASVATINSVGLATGTGVGTSAITASATSAAKALITNATTVTVTGTATTIARDLASISISPGAQTISGIGGSGAQFVAVGTYTSSPLTQDISTTVSWSSSQSTVATVNDSGLATAVGVGTTTITASKSNDAGSLITTTGTVVVAATTPAGLASISILPGAQTVSLVNEAAQFIAIGTFTGIAAATQDITGKVTWISSDVAVGSINNYGLATGNGKGTTAITATMPNAGGALIYGVATFTEGAVTDPPVGNVATLSVYDVGTGTGLVSASYTDPQSIVTLILGPCGISAPLCVGVVPLPNIVTVVATPGANSTFGGWSTNCTLGGTPNVCSLDMTAAIGNQTVTAIFNLKP